MPPDITEHIVDCSAGTAVDMVLDGPERAWVDSARQTVTEGWERADDAAAARTAALGRLRADALGSPRIRDLLTVLGLL